MCLSKNLLAILAVLGKKGWGVIKHHNRRIKRIGWTSQSKWRTILQGERGSERDRHCLELEKSEVKDVTNGKNWGALSKNL